MEGWWSTYQRRRSEARWPSCRTTAAPGCRCRCCGDPRPRCPHCCWCVCPSWLLWRSDSSCCWSRSLCCWCCRLCCPRRRLSRTTCCCAASAVAKWSSSCRLRIVKALHCLYINWIKKKLNKLNFCLFNLFHWNSEKKKIIYFWNTKKKYLKTFLTSTI